MFEEYQKHLEKAQELEEEINEKYDNLKKDLINNNILIKLEINNNEYFVKYINCINSLTKIVDNYKEIDKEQQRKLKKIKEKLDKKLIGMMNIYTFLKNKFSKL